MVSCHAGKKKKRSLGKKKNRHPAKPIVIPLRGVLCSACQLDKGKKISFCAQEMRCVWRRKRGEGGKGRASLWCRSKSRLLTERTPAPDFFVCFFCLLFCSFSSFCSPKNGSVSVRGDGNRGVENIIATHKLCLCAWEDGKGFGGNGEKLIASRLNPTISCPRCCLFGSRIDRFGQRTCPI